MKPFLKLKSVEEILANFANVAPLGAETVPLANALGRRLARDFRAPADLPGFARSTVDGYAVAARDVFGASETSPAFLRIAGDIRMGEKPAFALEPGQAARIATGGMLPEGADCVVMLEYARPLANEQVELARSQAPGDNVVAAADDAAKGELLIAAGKKIRPQEIGCLAAYGISEPQVYRKPAVAIISTGDEVVPIEDNPAPPMIRDINSHSLAALCKQAGAAPAQMGIIKDDPEFLRAKIASALEDSDIVAVSGGSSAGARDFTIETFLSFPDAELLAHGVAISPGKPFILARSGKKWLFGLPGHVAGALVCARVFLLPLLRKLQGDTSLAPAPFISARLSRSIASAQGRRDFIRCQLFQKDGGWEAIPLSAPSAVISSLVNADGLIVCPENREGLAKGEIVHVELL